MDRNKLSAEDDMELRSRTLSGREASETIEGKSHVGATLNQANFLLVHLKLTKNTHVRTKDNFQLRFLNNRIAQKRSLYQMLHY